MPVGFGYDFFVSLGSIAWEILPPTIATLHREIKKYVTVARYYDSMFMSNKFARLLCSSLEVVYYGVQNLLAKN